MPVNMISQHHPTALSTTTCNEASTDKMQAIRMIDITLEQVMASLDQLKAATLAIHIEQALQQTAATIDQISSTIPQGESKKSFARQMITNERMQALHGKLI